MRSTVDDTSGSSHAEPPQQQHNFQTSHISTVCGSQQSILQMAPQVYTTSAEQRMAMLPTAPATAGQPGTARREPVGFVHGPDEGQTELPASVPRRSAGPASSAPAFAPSENASPPISSVPGETSVDPMTAYRSELAAWVNSASPEEKASRQTAEQICHAYLAAPQKQDWTINVSDLKLSTLPPLPADLKGLVSRRNRLNRLPENLPQDLQRLDVIGNQLSSLPKNLPQGLRSLNANANELSTLPENLPIGLQILDVNANELSTLPENLPQDLQHLGVSVNHLSVLPKVLPARLQFLYASSNRLSTLPANLPTGLEILDISCNQLSKPPENLPPCLHTLNLMDNRLSDAMLVDFMKANTTITDFEFEKYDDNAAFNQEIEAELAKNKAHPARIGNAATTFDLFTRLRLTTDQTGSLVQRPSTPHAAGPLPHQPIPAELHDVLAASCSKDVLAVLAQMSEGKPDQVNPHSRCS